MRIPDFLKPGGGVPSMVASTILIFGMVALIGFGIDRGYIEYGDPVQLEFEATAGPQDGDIIPVTLAVRLTNTRTEGVELSAPNPCKIFRWILLDGSADLIMGEPPEVCAEVVMQSFLEGNHHLSEEFQIEIDARRLREGEGHQMMIRYWGFEARQPIDLFPSE